VGPLHWFCKNISGHPLVTFKPRRQRASEQVDLILLR
jgi:hypothetical protein